MGTRIAGVDLNSQHVQISPRHHLDIWNEAWADRVGDQVCEFLFRCKQKKLEVARHERLVMIQHNKLAFVQRIKLVLG
jgi:hypothetical protein